MASTINGYEGTGRSLSLKLIQQLRESTRPSLTKDSVDLNDTVTSTSSRKVLPSGKAMPKARTLREIQLEEPIRYGSGDKIEKWLHTVLCLDATVISKNSNSPNDLQLMSDAPAHHLFVLLPPLKDDESTLPDPLVVLQVSLEGNISRAAVMESLSRGERSSGDLIPWLMSQQVCHQYQLFLVRCSDFFFFHFDSIKTTILHSFLEVGLCE